MDTLIKIIKYIFESNIINFCLMVWLFVWLSKKFNIKSAFDESIKKVENYIENSKKEKENSDNLLKESKKLIKKLPTEVKKIEEFSNQKSEIFKKQLDENTQKNIEKINNTINNTMEIDEKQASNSVMTYSTVKSIEKTRKDIIEMLKSKPNLHYKFIDKSLEELDRLSL